MGRFVKMRTSVLARAEKRVIRAHTRPWLNKTCKGRRGVADSVSDLPDLRCPSFKSGHCLTKSTISNVAPISALLLAGRRAERYPRTSGAASPWSRGSPHGHGGVAAGFGS